MMAEIRITDGTYQPRPRGERVYRTQRRWGCFEVRRPLDLVLAHGACSFTEWHDAERYLEAEHAA